MKSILIAAAIVFSAAFWLPIRTWAWTVTYAFQEHVKPTGREYHWWAYPEWMHQGCEERFGGWYDRQIEIIEATPLRGRKFIVEYYEAERDKTVDHMCKELDDANR